MTKGRIVRDILAIHSDINKHADCAYGSDKYVIKALDCLVDSNFNLQVAIEQNIEESKKIEVAIKSFETSTIKTERTMSFLAIAQVLLAVVSLLVTVLQIYFK